MNNEDNNIENQNNENLDNDKQTENAYHDIYKPDPDKYTKEQEALKTARENSSIGNQSYYKEPDTVQDAQEPCLEEVFAKDEHVQSEEQNEVKQDPEKSFTTKVVIDNFDDTRLYSALCHFSNVLIFTILWIPALIYYFKNDDEIIKDQAKQAAIYGLAFAVIISVLISISISIPLACCFLLPITGLLFIVIWGYSIYLTYLSYNGNFFDIPIIKEIADKINI